MRKRFLRCAGAASMVAIGLFRSATALGDAPTTQPPATQPSGVESAIPPLTLSPIVVTAEKREQPLQDVPSSVTALDATAIKDENITNIRQASFYAPNLFIQQFTPPRESFPFIRGIGSGQNNPAVTTYIDGVPQLSFSTSNIQLVDIDRIEFVRGPQGTLYGRDTLGGVINIYTLQPGDTTHGDLQASGGNYALQDYRGGIRGPIEQGKLYYAFAGGYQSRDGYSYNGVTGHDLDSVNELFGRFELRYTPTPDWDLRLTLNGERDADGDFPLYDLDSLRHTPNRVEHDYVGEAHRNIDQIAFNAIFHGEDVDFTSVTALQYWNSKELTDLDETQFDLLRRSNREQERNFIEEVRLLSPNDKPIRISDNVAFHWITGMLLFATGDEPHVGDITRSATVSQGAPVPFTSFNNASLDSVGVGFYGQGTFTLWDKLDLTIGGRVDYEHQSADLDNFTVPPLTPATSTSLDKDYTEFAPRFEADYHWTRNLMSYANIAEGYKAGGFNATAPSTATTAFGPERSWSYEIGQKSVLLDNRLRINADLFYINWRKIQLDTPNLLVPSEFYISNNGEAHSEGIEAEGDYQLLTNLDVFAGFGFTHARFDSGVQPDGASAKGKRVPDAPETTWDVGVQYGLPLEHDWRFYVRPEVIGVGPYSYDVTNIAGQSAYILTNIRLGVTDGRWRVEGFIDNMFNIKYVPIAYQFPLAPSGYVGESGDPITFGVTVGYTF